MECPSTYAHFTMPKPKPQPLETDEADEDTDSDWSTEDEMEEEEELMDPNPSTPNDGSTPVDISPVNSTTEKIPPLAVCPIVGDTAIFLAHAPLVASRGNRGDHAVGSSVPETVSARNEVVNNLLVRKSTKWKTIRTHRVRDSSGRYVTPLSVRPIPEYSLKDAPLSHAPLLTTAASRADCTERRPFLRKCFRPLPPANPQEQCHAAIAALAAKQLKQRSTDENASSEGSSNILVCGESMNVPRVHVLRLENCIRACPAFELEDGKAKRIGYVNCPFKKLVPLRKMKYCREDEYHIAILL